MIVNGCSGAISISLSKGVRSFAARESGSEVVEQWAAGGHDLRIA